MKLRNHNAGRSLPPPSFSLPTSPFSFGPLPPPPSPYSSILYIEPGQWAPGTGMCGRRASKQTAQGAGALLRGMCGPPLPSGRAVRLGVRVPGHPQTHSAVRSLCFLLSNDLAAQSLYLFFSLHPHTQTCHRARLGPPPEGIHVILYGSSDNDNDNDNDNDHDYY